MKIFPSKGIEGLPFGLSLSIQLFILRPIDIIALRHQQNEHKKSHMQKNNPIPNFGSHSDRLSLPNFTADPLPAIATTKEVILANYKPTPDPNVISY